MSGLFDKWKSSLQKTKNVTFGKIATLFGSNEITADTWEELEAILLQADAGITTTNSIVQKLKSRIEEGGITEASAYQEILREELLLRLTPPPAISLENKPAIILIVGVNGSGKTTSIGKLGAYFQKQGKKVMFAAADTFRAAAVDQLLVWGERLHLPVVTGQENGDPGAVAFDAVTAAVNKEMDILLVDTAGRLHTRYNLMEELKKIHRVTAKAYPGAPHAVWIVLDCTTGQNAFQQAKMFKDAVKVDGVILAKLDSSAKGGMVFAIQQELGLPILFAGLGEKIEDLDVFDPQKFVSGIME